MSLSSMSLILDVSKKIEIKFRGSFFLMSILIHYGPNTLGKVMNMQLCFGHTDFWRPICPMNLNDPIFCGEWTFDLRNPMQNRVPNNFSSESFAEKCVLLTGNWKYQEEKQYFSHCIFKKFYFIYNWYNFVDIILKPSLIALFIYLFIDKIL